jgi:hypothetical protein
MTTWTLVFAVSGYTSATYTLSGAPTQNAWHFVSFSYDSAASKIYAGFDGTVASSTAVISSDTSLIFGTGPGNTRSTTMFTDIGFSAGTNYTSNFTIPAGHPSAASYLYLLSAANSGNYLTNQGTAGGTFSTSGTGIAFDTSNPFGASGVVTVYNSATVGNLITTNGVFWANGATALSSYGNATVAQYLPTYSGSIGTAVSTSGNLTVGGNLIVQGNITTINYDTILYTETANVLTANVLTVSGVNIISNVAGLQNQITGANTNISSINANIGSYYTFANANVAGLQNQITGANAVISTQSTWLGNLQANVYTNTNVAAYLLGNIIVGNITSTLYGNAIGTTATYTGNVTAGNVFANGLFWANGTVMQTGGGGSITYTANTAPPTTGNTVGSFWANGNAYSSGSSTKSLSIALNSGTVTSVTLSSGYLPVLNNAGSTVNIATY